MKHRYKSIPIVAGFALAVASGTTNADTVRWDMPNEYQKSSIHGEADQFFAERLEEKTDGDIEITHHFGGALGYKGEGMLDAVASGAVPIGGTLVGPLGGIDPIFLLSSLPFLAVTTEEARILLDVAMEDYREVYSENNQKLLFASPWPPSGIWAKKAADSKEALEDLKIRTYDPNGTLTFREIGASPVQVSWSDVIPQLNAGSLDAVLTSAELGTSASLWEHLPYFTEINYSMPLNIVTINSDVWNGLSESHQAAVMEAANETRDHQWEAVKERVKENYRTLDDNGGTVVTEIPKSLQAGFREAARPAIESWLEEMGQRGEEILSEYRKRTGRDQ